MSSPLEWLHLVDQPIYSPHQGNVVTPDHFGPELLADGSWMAEGGLMATGYAHG